MHLCLKICLTFDIERILNSEVDFYCKVHLFDRMNINLKLHFLPQAIFGIIEYPDQLNIVTPTALHNLESNNNNRVETGKTNPKYDYYHNESTGSRQYRSIIFL